MKKNEEKILKYLSNQMTDEERIQFDEELLTSIELNKKLTEIQLKLSNIQIENEPKADELYFANLIPKVRERIEKKNKFWRMESFYYLVPTAASVVVLFMFVFNSKNSFETQYKEIANEVVNNFSDQEVSEHYLTDLESDPANSIITNGSEEINVQIPSDMEIKNDSYIQLIGNPITEEFSTLDKLSDSDLEKVYSKLNSLTSQKVSK